MEPGTRLGHYTIIRRIGRGGMGEVYLAEDPRLRREVALKVVGSESRTSPAARERLVREAQSAAGLSHPGICAVYDVGEESGEVYVAMELLEGQTLQEAVEEGPMDARRATRLGVAIAEALAHAHDRGVIHRDLKPANIFLTRDGHTKILDFGIAKAAEAREVGDSDATRIVVTREGEIVGTPAAMAPELFTGGTASYASDVWSLGISLYEMVSGRLPFEGSTGVEVASNILHKQPPPLDASVPRRLRQVIERCLAKSPGDRFGSASEVADALREVGVTIETGGLAPIPVRRSSLVWLAAAVILVVAAIAWFGTRVAPTAGTPSTDGPALGTLAVLPVRSDPGNAEAELLARGVTQGLIDTTGARGIAGRVLAYSAVAPYSAAAEGRDAAVAALGADSALTATLSLTRGEIGLEVSLYGAGLPEPRWHESYRVPEGFASTLPSTVTRDLATALALAPGSGETTPAATVDPEVYRTYLRAQLHLSRRTPDDLREALDLLRQVVALDPENAAAYAAIAQTYYLMAGFGYAVISPVDVIPLATAAATKAVELAPSLSDAHAALALARMQSWDWSGGEEAFRNALDLNPSNASARQQYGALLTALGRFDEARAQLEQAALLDPVSMVIVQSRSNVAYFAGDLDAAIRQSRTVLDLVPGFWPSLMILGGAHMLRGELDLAEQVNDDALETTSRNPFIVAVAGLNYLRQGNADAAAAALQELLELRGAGRYVSPVLLAKHELNAGNLDAGFAYLDEAVQDRDQSLMFLAVDPQYPPAARADARFDALLETVGLVDVPFAYANR